MLVSVTGLTAASGSHLLAVLYPDPPWEGVGPRDESADTHGRQRRPPLPTGAPLSGGLTVMNRRHGLGVALAATMVIGACSAATVPSVASPSPTVASAPVPS